jgi:hypothetical protein
MDSLSPSPEYEKMIGVFKQQNSLLLSLAGRENNPSDTCPTLEDQQQVTAALLAAQWNKWKTTETLIRGMSDTALACYRKLQPRRPHERLLD